MSRVVYSEDEDYPGQFALFRGNMNRSIASKAGRAALADLRAALDALPEKRLVGHYLVKDGEVCANGALVAYRRQLAHPELSREQILAEMSREIAPPCEECWHKQELHGAEGCTKCPERIIADAARRVEDLAQYGEAAERWTYRTTICPAYKPPEEDNYSEEDEETGLTEQIAQEAGVPRLMAWAIVEINDDLGGYRDMTPEQRYESVSRWVDRRIANPKYDPYG